MENMNNLHAFMLVVLEKTIQMFLKNYAIITSLFNKVVDL